MNRKRLAKLALGLAPIAAPVLLCGLAYWTWCWGLWGRGNLLLQALFQCRCPAVSEQARYKPFKVVSSACAEPYLLGFSPNGRYVLLSEQRPESRAIRLDLMTGETLDISFGKGYPILLTDDLMFGARHYPTNQYFLSDLIDKTVTELPPVESLEAAMVKLKEADRVWVTNDQFSYPYVIGIVEDYKHNTQGNIAFTWQGKKQELFDILKESGVKYDFIPPPYIIGSISGARYSSNGRFYARSIGIYLIQTEQLIVPSEQTPGSPTAVGPQGWVLDNHAVVYGGGGYRYLLEGDGSIFGHDYFPVPQPILLLEVPPQYWATPTPAP